MINYARHRRAVEKLYEDTCTVSRTAAPSKKASGETKLGQPQVIHESKPCRLSQKALSVNSQTEAANNVAYETKLFIEPELEIKQGDTITVTHYGRTQSYTAGEPFIYSSHQEISLQREGKA